MTRTGDREIGVVSWRLPDNTGELACMHTWENIVENACGFLSSKHPNSIESLKHYYTYITYVNPERLGLSNHSILHKILSV